MSQVQASPEPEFAVRINQTSDLEVLTVVTDAAIATLQLRGEMDLSNAELLTAVLDHQLALGRRFARLDLSHLRFLDCAGLRAIVLGHNRFLAGQGTLVLTGVSTRVARLLLITGLDEALFTADAVADVRYARRPNHLHLAADG
jgi:anti-sigma B factor antagonist